MDHDRTDHDTARPGSPAAERRGCRCSVLLNRHTPDQGGDEPAGFVNPLCPVHGPTELGSELPSTS
jgi:hypothetical protein